MSHNNTPKIVGIYFKMPLSMDSSIYHKILYANVVIINYVQVLYCNRENSIVKYYSISTIQVLENTNTLF